MAPIPPDAEPAEDDLPVHSPDHSRRYQVLSGLGQQIAQKGADNVVKFEEVRDKMNEILESLTESVDGQVRDARGRPRGRPRKRGHSQPERSSKTKSRCLLCNSETHGMKRCRHYPLFQDESRKYEGSSEGRRCSVCHYGGHRKDTCPVLLRARDRVTEEGLNRRRD
jgi:hypothetical protein